MSGKIFFVSSIAFFICFILNIRGVVADPITLLAVGFISPFVTISFLLSGIWWIAKKLAKVQMPSPTLLDRQFSSSNPHELVDFIDMVSNSCLIAVNNVWLQENWCKLSDKQKTEWVISRFGFLESQLAQSYTDAISIINAIQAADKQYHRLRN